MHTHLYVMYGVFNHNLQMGVFSKDVFRRYNWINQEFEKDETSWLLHYRNNVTINAEFNFKIFKKKREAFPLMYSGNNHYNTEYGQPWE